MEIGRNGGREEGGRAATAEQVDQIRVKREYPARENDGSVQCRLCMSSADPTGRHLGLADARAQQRQGAEMREGEIVTVAVK